MTSYNNKYVFTAKEHPKRGHMYGRSFTIVRQYKDIRDVIWDDRSRGHVRENEYCRIDQWLENDPRYQVVLRERKEAREAEERAQAKARREAEELAAWEKRQVELDQRIKELEKRLREEQANKFKLEYTT